MPGNSLDEVESLIVMTITDSNYLIWHNSHIYIALGPCTAGPRFAIFLASMFVLLLFQMTDADLTSTAADNQWTR
jgi:hypothetical protein